MEEPQVDETKKNFLEAQSLVEQSFKLLMDAKNPIEVESLIEQAYDLIVDAKEDPICVLSVLFLKTFLKTASPDSGQSE